MQIASSPLGALPALVRRPPRLVSVALAALALATFGCSTSSGPGRGTAHDAAPTQDVESSPSAETPSHEPVAGGDQNDGKSGSSKIRGGDESPALGEMLSAELTTVGWDQITGSPVVLLRELASGDVLPIWIGMAEARAISLELHGVALQRPMTHDLMANLLRQLDAELEEVHVHDLRQGTYFGLLKLRVAGQKEARWVDTRPSDGLALALRTDAEIRIARKLLDERPEYRFQAPDSTQQVVRALGLTVVSLEDVWREEFSYPDDLRGLVIIATSGEARRKGLERGDLILELNGSAPAEPVDLLTTIAESPISEGLEITFWRDGSEHRVRLSLEVAEPPQTDSVV